MRQWLLQLLLLLPPSLRLLLLLLPPLQAYEELLSLQRQVDSLKAANEEATENAELSSAEISGLKARLADLSQQLDQEKQARQLAAAEAESRWNIIRNHSPNWRMETYGDLVGPFNLSPY